MTQILFSFLLSGFLDDFIVKMLSFFKFTQRRMMVMVTDEMDIVWCWCGWCAWWWWWWLLLLSFQCQCQGYHWHYWNCWRNCSLGLLIHFYISLWFVGIFIFSITKICTLTLKLLLNEPSSRILDSVSIFLYNFLGISIYLLLFI